jgi:small-conductance mechanosensitive channel
VNHTVENLKNFLFILHTIIILFYHVITIYHWNFNLLNFEFFSHKFSFFGAEFYISQFFSVVLVIFFGSTLIKFSFKYLSPKKSYYSEDFKLLFKRLYFSITYCLLALFSLSLLDIPLTAFAFISGALAIGVGFGAQNIISNFISGWILIWERPIRIGDFLEIEGFKGKVETISTRSTIIRRVDGVRLVIPNSKLLEETVINWNLNDNYIRGHIRVGITYDSDINLAKLIMLDIFCSDKKILKEPTPVIFFDDFADFSLILDGYFWIEMDVNNDVRTMASNFRFQIKEKFEANKINFAFPRQDISLLNMSNQKLL